MFLLSLIRLLSLSVYILNKTGTAVPVLFNMYTDKDSNLIRDLRNNYGENSVRTFRKWEIITKKMADYRNHRRFMLKCIKASITPVSCKLKKPPSFRTSKSYQIIHKAEKQLLYECIRNINGILATLDKQRIEQYTKFKDSLSSHNHANTAQISVPDSDPVSDQVQDQELDLVLDRSRLFINRIKEHWHEKIKRKQIDKFKRLYYKHYGCHHNLNRHTQFFDNTDHNSSSLSGQPNVPSSFSPRSSTTSITSSVPATPRPPHLPPAQWPHTQQRNPQQQQPQQPSYMYRPYGQVGYQSFPNPPNQQTIIPPTKRSKLCYHPQIPPIDAYIMATEQASSRLPTQEVDEFTSDDNRLLKQQQHNNHCNLNPAQCRALTQLKQDSSRVVLTVDKGVAMVIMDQQDYNNKAQALLQDTNTYRVLNKDPTPQIKSKLITLLKNIKQTGGLSNQKYKQLYPPVQSHPNFMAYPKFTKQVPLLDPLFPVGGPSHMG